MKVVLVARSLDGVLGGLEKFLIGLANSLVRHNIEVSIITIDKEDASSKYALDSRISWYKINIGDSNNKASFLIRLKRQIEITRILRSINGDVALTFMYGSYILSLIPSLLSRTKIVLTERTSPSVYSRHSLTRKLKILVNLSMHFSDGITVQFDRYKQFYPKYLQDKMIALPNPVDEITNNFKLRNGEISLLYAGRISEEKNLLSLLQHLNTVPFPYVLNIVGEGEQKRHLQDFVVQNQLENNVFFFDFVEDLGEFFAKTDLSVMPSLWEGFPNFAAESLAHGIPVLGLDTCDGIIDLVKSSYNGWLLAQTEMRNSTKHFFTEQINFLIRNEVIFMNCKNSVAKFKREYVVKTWIEYIESLSKIN